MTSRWSLLLLPPNVDPADHAMVTYSVSSALICRSRRAFFRGENTAKRNPSYLYGDVTRLLLPDKTSIVPLQSQNDISPSSAVTRNNWIDFAVPLSTNVKQLTLRLGTATEAQIDIPLTDSADLSKYQPKTVTPQKQASYAGATLTVTQATE